MTIESVDVGDVKLSVRVEGSGAPLLLVHGFPLDHTMWDQQIRAWKESFLVIAPDLRGFGKSQTIGKGRLSMARFADDLAVLLDQLKVDVPVVFCGLSMGGYIAWEFWQRHRRKISELVLCDTRAAADTDVVRHGRFEMANRALNEGVAFLVDGMVEKLFAESTRRQTSDIVTKMADVMRRTSPMAVAAALHGMAERLDMTDQLRNIDVPVRVICGAEDVLTSPAEMQAMASLFPSASFHLIPDAGHMAPVENPTAVNRVLSESTNAMT
jgi:pimeloyl-ACP methyl ester carboxylesterase